MQDPQDRRAPRCPRIPAEAAHELHGRCNQRDQRRQRAAHTHPQRQRQRGGAQRRVIKGLVAPLADATQCVGGEHRHDATGHGRFEQDDERQRGKQDTQRIERDDARHGEVEKQIGQAEGGQDAANGVVALAAGAYQDAHEEKGADRQEGDIDGRRPRRCRKQQCHPACQPQRGEGGEEGTVWRAQPGPGLSGREQEADDDGRCEAEQHFVRMPPGAGHRQRHAAAQHHQPERNGDGREQRSKHVEGTEAERKQREGAGWNALRGGFVEVDQCHMSDLPESFDSLQCAGAALTMTHVNAAGPPAAHLLGNKV